MPASLGNFVWEDYNNDGVQDPNEPGLQGIEVTLYDANNNPIATTTTGANGEYEFTNLVPGDYFVEFELPEDYIFSPQDSGAATEATDSDVDPATGRTELVTLASGENNPDIDAGMSFAEQSIGDTVWFDVNQDGVQDVDEPGVAGVTVNLLVNGMVVATTATDGEGNYLFPDLDAGVGYQLEFIPPAGYQLTTTDSPDALNDGFDSDADDGTGLTGIYTLADNEQNVTVDAGIFIPDVIPASLGDTVWYDANNDGVQDPAEAGIPGVVVNLYDGAGVLVASTLTDTTGNYLFEGLHPGDYQVEVVPPVGYDFSPQDASGDEATDSDVDGMTGLSPVVTLAEGEARTDLDAGLFAPAGVASLGDTVWLDSNGDGVNNEAATAGVPGVTVDLYLSDGTFVATTTTDDNGNYLFENLQPGDYFVDFQAPDGYDFTVADQGADTADSDADPGTGESSIISLAAGEVNLDVDAGLVLEGGIAPASIGDTVWEDYNHDGIQDPTEPGLAGVVVELFDENNLLVATTTTDGNGNYLFPNLVPGDYYVHFIPPNGYEISPIDSSGDEATDSDADEITGATPLITHAAGEDNRDVDAGMTFFEQSLGDTVWFDIDQDGVQDVDELGISGVTVNLYDDMGTLLDTVVTDGNGNYLFEDLEEGVPYVIEVITPSGFTPTIQDAGAAPTEGFDSDIDPMTGRTDPIILADGEANVSVDAGFFNPTLIPASLGDTVWLDANGDGIQDPTETGVPGVVVNLYNSAGMLVATQITDANGKYEFYWTCA